jgi:hypothetical protein
LKPPVDLVIALLYKPEQLRADIESASISTGEAYIDAWRNSGGTQLDGNRSRSV